MQEITQESQTIVYRTEMIRYRGPIWTLILLAPFIAEVLSGSTRLSVLFVYIPEVMVWGVGALLCRELARRWRAGGTSLLLLGLALSVAEEFLIQQTSVAPLPFPGVHADYGRLWGVNLVYLLFMLGFESVWVVVVPVQLTELFFPQQSREPWLRTRGWIVACALFLLGCGIAWYGWTQQARPRLQATPYHPTVALLGVGIGSIGLLTALAYLLRGVGRRRSATDRREIAPVWLAGLTAFVAGGAWFFLITEVFIPNPVQPYWLLMAAGILWAALAFFLLTRWSAQPGWGPVHRFWAAAGATLACMVPPYLNATTWARADLIAEAIFTLIGIVILGMLGRRVFLGQRAAATDLSSPSDAGK